MTNEKNKKVLEAPSVSTLILIFHFLIFQVELQYIFGFVDRQTEQKFKYFKTALVEKHTAKDRNIEILEVCFLQIYAL